MISLIDLLGMAIGFGIFLTLLGWIRFDTSFDKFHKDIDRMYLLNVRITMNNTEYKTQRTGGNAFWRAAPSCWESRSRILIPICP